MVSINTIQLGANSKKSGWFGRWWRAKRAKIISAVIGLVVGGPIGALVSGLVASWLDNSARIANSGLSSISIPTLNSYEANQVNTWLERNFLPVVSKVITDIDGVLVLPTITATSTRVKPTLQAKIDKVNKASRISNLLMKWAENQANNLERGWSKNASLARLELMEVVMDSIQKAIDKYVIRNGLDQYVSSTTVNEVFSQVTNLDGLRLDWTNKRVMGSYVYLRIGLVELQDPNGNTGEVSSGGTSSGTQQTTNPTTAQQASNQASSKNSLGIWKYIGIGVLGGLIGRKLLK